MPPAEAADAVAAETSHGSVTEAGEAEAADAPKQNALQGDGPAQPAGEVGFASHDKLIQTLDLAAKLQAVQPSEPPATEPRVVTNTDPRMLELEPLIAASDWASVIKQLGPAESAGRLPPNLGIIYAVACKEMENAPAEQIDLNEVAIRCAAGLFGVEPDSPIALLLAKRLLRKNPVNWKKRPAPRPMISFIIIIVALVLGGLFGWAASVGYIRFHFP